MKCIEALKVLAEECKSIGAKLNPNQYDFWRGRASGLEDAIKEINKGEDMTTHWCPLDVYNVSRCLGYLERWFQEQYKLASHPACDTPTGLAKAELEGRYDRPFLPSFRPLSKNG